MQKIKQSARGRSTRISAWLLTLSRIVRSDPFQYTFLILFVDNAIRLGLVTSPSVRHLTGDGEIIFYDVIIVLFILVVALKVMVFGTRFFKSRWNNFYITLVSFSRLPQLDYLRVLRGLRVIQAIRGLSFLPQYRKMMQALLDAQPCPFISAENRALAAQFDAVQLQAIKTLERLEEQIETKKRDSDERP